MHSGFGRRWRFRRIKTHYILAFLIFATSVVSGQSTKQIREIFTQAESVLLYNEDYEMALPLYRMLADLVPENVNYQYKVGICYLNIPGKAADAIPWLEKATRNTTEDYSYSFKEDHAPVDAYFYLGSAHHILNQLDDAVRYYREFLQHARYEDLYFKDFVRQQIRNCEHAASLQEEPAAVKKIRLGDQINAYRRNTFPLISYDGTVLIYTAMPGTAKRIMMSVRESNHWSLPQDITDQLNAGDDSHATGLSYHGDTLLIYKEEGGKADIWMSIYRDTAWAEMWRLGKNINTKYWESSASLTPDGKHLYFSSNRKGGYGGLDLYVSDLNPDGTWGVPRNLGSVVNTPLLEDNPYVTVDGGRLYFASQGHYNMGGFDIFYTTRTLYGRWSKPVNIGYPVNTTDDNLFYYPLGSGDTALTSVVSFSGLSGTEDIYRIEFLPEGYISSVKIEGTVLIDGGGTVDPGTIISIRDQNTGKKLAELKPDTVDGTWSFEVSPGRYNIDFNAPEYQPLTEEIEIPTKFSQSIFALETHLLPKETGKGDVFFMKSVYFDEGKSQLSPELKKELFRLTALLKEYPALKFEVAGMTDTSRHATNQEILAARRAKEVVAFLAAQGISRDRFTVRAAGAIGVKPLGQQTTGAETKPSFSPRRIDIRLLRTDTSFRYTPELFVPEYAQARSHLTYSILMLKLDKKLPPDYFYRYNIEELNYVKVDEVNGEYYYTLGSFKNKSQAIEMLGKLFKLGFRQARIIDDPELEELLQKPEPQPRKYINRSKELEEIPFYTIQIYALKKNRPHAGAFRGLEDISIWPCTDGFVRYTFGSFQGWSVALKELDKIKALGFRDAFIRPVTQLEEMVIKE